MPQHQIVIDVNHEPGSIPILKVSAQSLAGPNLIYYLKTLLHELEVQVLVSVILQRLHEMQGAQGPQVSPGGIVLPGMVPPKDLRG